MRRWPTVVLVVLVLLVGLSALPAGACEQLTEPSFSQAAVKEGVVGVVERQTLASNPFPWGASISVATRIWGGITAERWKVSDRNFVACPLRPPTDVGQVEYDFRGSEAEWGSEYNAVVLDTNLSVEQELILETQFGAAEVMDFSGLDRTMAIVRMWGLELTAAAVVVLAGLVSLIRRRRAGRYDRHLF
jgi:hypothetical protein